MTRRANRIHRLGLAIAICAVLCGSEEDCHGPHSVPSARLETEFIAAGMTVRAIGNGRTFLRIVLTNGSNDVDLSGGDRLVANRIDAATQTVRSKTLIEQENLDSFAYTGAFNSQEDDRIDVVFDRSATGEESAAGSSVTMPTPFELDWVEDPGTMQRAPRDFSRSASDPVHVVWTPFDAFDPGDVLTYDVVGNCIQTYFGTIDWAGGQDSLSLTDVLVDQPPPHDGKACLLHVLFTLRRTGVVDPAFRSGTFTAEQIRDIHIQSRP